MGIGTSSPDTLLHLKSSGSGEPKIKIENTNADQHQGMIHFYKTGSSPADADAIGSVAFYADNSADEETLFGDIKSYTDDVTDDQNQFLKLVKDITSKGFVRNNYKKKLVDLSDIRINLKGKK